MRHLILGGGGFIGSHLSRRLVAEGHEVTRADIRFPVYRLPLWNGANSVRADLRHAESVQDLFGMLPRPWDVVWQLAADMGGVEYFHSDFDWAAAVNNQLINTQVMKYAVDYGVGRVVFTSTACALATEVQKHTAHDKLREEDLEWGTPDQLYGQEKRNSAVLWKAAPMDSRVVFLHTVYGPYQEHSGIKMKFPMAVAMKARAARETGALELLGDGRQIRTFMYIKDAIDRLVRVGMADTTPGDLNIGGVTPYSCWDVHNIALEAAGVDPLTVTTTLKPDGPTGVEYRTCNMSKFERVFPGYPYRTLQSGMKKTIKWLDKVNA